MKITGVVVLYHPTLDTVVNIRSYEPYLDEIYLVDNSPNDEMSEKIREKLIGNGVNYHSMGDNEGIAKALNFGLRKALENGSDYLLTMDQDSRFPDGVCEKYFAKVSDLHEKRDDSQTAIYVPNPDMGAEVVPSIEDLKKAITSGSLMHLDVIRKIGMFDDNLFIDWVDFDICYRARKKGFKIQKLNWVPMIHCLGKRESIQVGPFSFTIVTHSAFRYYYMVRNKFYVLDKNECSGFKKIHYTIGTIKAICRVILLEKDKINKLKCIYRGIYDYRHQVKGKKFFLE